MAFELRSDDIVDARLGLHHALNGFGHRGENVSPQLAWGDPPEGTKSLALTMFDPDPASDSGFWHWLVVDLPAGTRELTQAAGAPGGDLPAGAVQTLTDFGAPGYHGPAPSPGQTNTYRFRLHALSVERLDVEPGSTGGYVSMMINADSIARATLEATYP